MQARTTQISLLQRRLRIGYTCAARLIETMQEKGILGPDQPKTRDLSGVDFTPTTLLAEE